MVKICGLSSRPEEVGTVRSTGRTQIKDHLTRNLKRGNAFELLGMMAEHLISGAGSYTC